MRYNVYLLKYNNAMNKISYVNHTIEYLLTKTVYTKNDVNFEINDGVNTALTFNVSTSDKSDYLDCDYALIYDKDLQTYSKWFIVPGTAKKIRGCQFTCNLNRDTIAENFEQITKSKGYIERGYLDDTSPLALLKEQFSCNQIKTKQIPIADFTPTTVLGTTYHWLKRREHILAFIDRKQLTEDVTLTISGVPTPTIEITGSLSNYEYYNFVNNMTTTNDEYFQCKDQDLTIIKLTHTVNGITTIEYYQVSFEDYSTYDTVKGKLQLYQMNSNTNITVTLSTAWFGDAILKARNPYIILAIPFWDVNTPGTGSSKLRSYGYMILNALQDKFGNAMFDVQLTPYSSEEIAKCQDVPTSNYHTLRLINDTFYSVANVNYSEDVGWDNYLNKIIVNTRDYFVKSPTGTNSYNFNIAYYNRELLKAYISATYKPYSSIVNIKFDKTSFYVANVGFNDNIELSFSLPHLTRYNDAWTQYQLNNKNYKEIFETNLSKQAVDSSVGALGSIVGGAASGAAMGSIVPGIGTAIGAAAGAVGGAVAGGMSMIGTYVGQQYERKNFELQLGNIKAQPRSLSSVSEMDFSYKGFAYIEVYDTTEDEAYLFTNYYNRISYTVNAYDDLNYYINNYWGDEIHKPVYFKGYIMQLANGYYISPNYYLDINKKLSDGYYIVHENDPS